MARIVVCADCGASKEHYAKGFCYSCWRKWRRKLGNHRQTRVICKKCGGNKLHHALGLCDSCYLRHNRESRREQVNAQAREYRWHNPERHKQADRRSYQKHAETRRLHARRYKREHREYYTLLENQRRTRKVALPDTLTIEERKAKLSIGRCFFCGTTENLTLDHFVPISADNNNACGTTLANTILLCRKCNSSKYNKMPMGILDQMTFLGGERYGNYCL